MSPTTCRYLRTMGVGALASMIIFVVVAVPWYPASRFIFDWSFDLVKQMAESRDYPAWFITVVARVSTAAEWVPPLVVALLVFHVCTRRLYSDGRLRCLNCKHVLSGLNKPECPQCGTRI